MQAEKERGGGERYRQKYRQAGFHIKKQNDTDFYYLCGIKHP